jgi:chromate transporter
LNRIDPKVKKSVFLKDVLNCSLIAYGGPEAHMGIFLDQLVSKKSYLTEEELVELLALCSILPGPTSSQTIVAVGYQVGGPWLGLLTMLVWGAPVMIVMGALSFLFVAFSHFDISSEFLNYIGPMAVGFVLYAAIKINKKVSQGFSSNCLTFLSLILTYLIRDPWVFPLILVMGGWTSIYLSKEKEIWNKVEISPPWVYFHIFLMFAFAGLGASYLFESQLLKLFENFYRYGYLVFGGGQVVVPVMHSELVEVNQHMTDAEFLTGYGFVQGLPGPMFSFASYAGGLVARNGSTSYQILGSLLAGIGIFLPGLLLIYFIYPVWEQVKSIRAIKISLKGINATAGGMIISAAIILLQNNGWGAMTLAVTTLTTGMLLFKVIPAPYIVLLCMMLGLII